MFKNFIEKPDVILMDHRMPIKNGIEASKEIMENSIAAKPKIIFASADKTVKEEAISIGVQSFKEKPFTLNNLFSNIEKVLKGSNLK
jgi:two-component system chemotaxis response regulator CheY